MGMPLKQFSDEILEPTLSELKENFCAPHKGFAAILVVDSLASHIYLALKENSRDPFAELGLDPQGFKVKDDSAFGHLLAKSNSAFQLIRDTAKANKHAKLTRHTPRVNGSADTKIQSISYGAGTYGKGRFGGPPQLVITELDGTQHLLETVISDAVKFLTGTANKLELM